MWQRMTWTVSQFGQNNKMVPHASRTRRSYSCIVYGTLCILPDAAHRFFVALSYARAQLIYGRRVRLSHTGNASKLMIVGSRTFLYLIIFSLLAYLKTVNVFCRHSYLIVLLWYQLRQRSHNKIMISKTADLTDSDFIVRMLYKDSY